MTLGGFTVLLTDTSPVQSVTYYDNDQDAFYEADTTVVADSSTKQLRSRTLNRYDPLTKRKIGRRFENRRDETTMDVTVEEWDTTGALICVSNLSTAWWWCSPTAMSRRKGRRLARRAVVARRARQAHVRPRISPCCNHA